MMNRLTDRLQLMADQINKGETMADIGTDHGFLPLYLYDKGICPKVIMTDISEPSLAKARTAFADRAGCNISSCSYEFRAGDGLSVIENGEADAVVIAGMGGLLIRDIIEADIDKSFSVKKFILQPRNNSGQLRYRLAANGFRITDNLLVREGKFICEIIVAVPGEKSDDIHTDFIDFAEDPNAPQWDFPHEFIERYPVLGLEFAKVKLDMEMKIRNGIMKSCNVCERDINSVENRISYYKNILGV